MKQYKSVDLDLRWHPSTRSITLNGKLKESINEKLIHLALVTGQLNNKDTEHAATDKYCMNEPELSDCNCAHLNADMEGIKLDTRKYMHAETLADKRPQNHCIFRT